MIASPHTDHRHHVRRAAHAAPSVCLHASNKRVGYDDGPLQSVACAAFLSPLPSTSGRPGHSGTLASCL